MSRFHVRCRHCETRRVLPKHPDEYRTLPQCRCCAKRSYRVDTWMQARDTKKSGCTCGGYWFFHRMGSKYCHNRKNGTRRAIGDADFNDRGYEEYLAGLANSEGMQNETYECNAG